MNSVSASIDTLTRIATEVVQDHGFRMQVLGAVSDGSADYAEIIVCFDDDPEQCPVQLGVFRDAESDALRDRIVGQVRHLLSSFKL